MSQQELAIDMEERRVTRTVNVKLSPAEKAQAMDSYNGLRDQMHELDKEFSKIKGEHKMKLDELEQEAEKTRLKAKNGDARLEECVEKRFFSSNTVQTWFGDELVEERPMTYEERQMNIGDVQHGVVMEEDEAPESPEDDLKGVMRDEQRADKPSLVN